MPNSHSIQGLRIYQASRNLEDAVYELVRQLPDKESYRLGDDLRRSSAAISHYISECHRRYNYSIKLEALHLARIEAEKLQKLLSVHHARGYGATTELQAGCMAITKQSWGLIRYIRRRQDEQQAQARTQAVDALVGVRS